MNWIYIVMLWFIGLILSSMALAEFAFNYAEKKKREYSPFISLIAFLSPTIILLLLWVIFW